MPLLHAKASLQQRISGRVLAFSLALTVLLSPRSGVPLVATSPSDSCLAYGPLSVPLHGTLTVLVHAGPPNYRDTLAGDVMEKAAILKLGRPICLTADANTNAGPEMQSETAVSEVQLVLDPDGWSSLYRLQGRSVAATGSLFHGVSAHHLRPVLMDNVRLVETRD